MYHISSEAIWRDGGKADTRHEKHVGRVLDKCLVLLQGSFPSESVWRKGVLCLELVYFDIEPCDGCSL
jgi:hypothetical protein